MGGVVSDERPFHEVLAEVVRERQAEVDAQADAAAARSRLAARPDPDADRRTVEAWARSMFAPLWWP